MAVLSRICPTPRVVTYRGGASISDMFAGYDIGGCGSTKYESIGD